MTGAVPTLPPAAVPTPEILRRKRDGEPLTADQISSLVSDIAQGRIGESQVGAFAMAVFLRGMDDAETLALTRAMRDSGRVLSWPDLPGPVLDKHSTGGVGDCVSLVLAPLVAACGGFVPMISGRGLGHTGGTLDKLEAIPGYDCQPGLDVFQACVRETGLAIVGAGPELAPADRRLYAVRDVTATVESLPLIVSSILSKKLAAGLDALVLDVKYGSGAGLADPVLARRLSHALLATAAECGLSARALLTDMNQPLADAVGNALEVRAALRVLCGQDHDCRLRALTLALAEATLLAGGLAATGHNARARLERVLDNGAAAECFAAMVARLGGPADLLEHEDRYLAKAPVIAPVFAEGTGFLHSLDARAMGQAVVALGGGRQRPEQVIDPAVGLSAVAALGTPLDPHTPLAIIHARRDADWQAAAAAIRAACVLGPDPIAIAPLVLE